jgi:UDP-glucose 4-epimerase
VGGNGFIGSHLQDELKLHGYRVRVLSRSCELFRPIQKGIEYIEGDYTERKALKVAVQGCDILIHLAHNTNPLGSVRTPEREIFDHVDAFVEMLSFVKDNGIRNIVYVSSGGAVYGNPALFPVLESSELNPISPYGASKVMIEKYLHMYAYLNGLNYLIIRPSNPYGPRQNYLGNQGVIPKFMHKLMHGEPIEIWGDGTASKNYIYIDDFVQAFRMLLDRGLNNTVYNIASGDATSLNELLAVLADVCGVSPKVKYQQARRADVQRIILSYDKLSARIGWKPSTSLEQGIKATKLWLLSLAE